jgi:hypothetical protein
MFNIDKLIYQLGKVPYASVYNLQPWGSKNNNISLHSSLQYPDRLMMKLRKQGAVKKVPLYPAGEEKRHFRDHTFYSLKSTLNKSLLGSKSYNGYIALDMVRHQSGLMDIFFAFINLYPDYQIEIDVSKEFKYIKNGIKKTYEPDGFVKLISPDMKEYHFLIEFERTKSNKEIRNDKISKINDINKFGTYGLSRHTRVLIFYTYEIYNVYTRPNQYNDPAIKKYHDGVETRLKTLIKDNSDVLKNFILFLPFHKFHQLNRPIWKNHEKENLLLVQ